MLKMFFIKDTLIVDHIFLNTIKDLKKKKKKVDQKSNYCYAAMPNVKSQILVLNVGFT